MRSRRAVNGVTLLLLGAWAAAAPAYAADVKGFHFMHKDWEVACDNTGTCRAAGYQADETDNPPVSILLERAAGPGQKVTAKLQVGNYGDDRQAGKTVAGAATIRINKRSVGKVTVKPETMIGTLSPAQVDALLAALPKSSELSLSIGEDTWTVSGAGATAVLLKMDEFQRRIGTPGALVRKGSGAESAVLLPVPPPEIKAAAVPATAAGQQLLSGADLKLLFGELRKTVKADECEDLAEVAKGEKQLSVERLSATRLLVSAQCWQAAYNSGTGYWVANTKAPFSPRLVTADASDYGDGTITSAQKGRGLGDCWSSDSWTWDGQRFVRTSSTSTGMCRLVAPGGAWDLPTVVATVVAAGGK